KRPEGLDPQEARRQRLEARRVAKEQALAEKRRRERRARLIRLVALAALGLTIFWFVFLRGRGPSEIDGNPIETLSTAGSGLHTGQDVSYESAPPVSGEHRPGAPGCGTYAQQLEDELQVHALEHGATGIQYAPDLDAEQIEAIEKFAGDYEKDVFSAPYEGMQTPVTVTSWGKKMQLDSFDEDTAREYVDTFAGGGPEGATNDCDNTESATFTPAGEVSPSPLESLPPEPSPEGKPKGKPDDKATASP
ncbi:MAG: DUF3105 domain-containing protein, partial [Actinomycetota bacterium]